MTDRLNRPADKSRPLLTEQRLAMLCLYANGHNTEQVADALGLNVNTVGRSIRITCQRLGATTREQAVAVAIARQLISMDDIRIPEADPPRVRGVRRKDSP